MKKWKWVMIVLTLLLSTNSYALDITLNDVPPFNGVWRQIGDVSKKGGRTSIFYQPGKAHRQGDIVTGWKLYYYTTEGLKPAMSLTDFEYTAFDCHTNKQVVLVTMPLLAGQVLAGDSLMGKLAEWKTEPSDTALGQALSTVCNIATH